MYYLSSTLDTGGTAIKYKDNKIPCFYGAYFWLWGPNNKPQNVYVLQRKYDLLRKI